MEPLNKELTRMGGYLENDYGWTDPQERFTQSLFKKAQFIAEYDKYYDVVVVGDSFSDNQSYGWQNYFVNETGLSLISFNMTRIPLERILDSRPYKTHPPKLLIYQSVERNILDRHSTCPSEIAVVGDYTPPAITMNPLGAPTVKLVRNQKIYSSQGLDFNAAINYTKKALLRGLFDLNITEVHKFQLSKEGLFSTREKSSVLVFTRDFNIKGATQNQIETAQCSLLALQNTIRMSNTTEFIALAFPDKTTIYSDFILDKSYTNMSIMEEIENTPGLNIPHLVADFQQAVSNGVVDFYLPNDTHCGSAAYKMAGIETVNLLKRLVSITPP